MESRASYIDTLRGFGMNRDAAEAAIPEDEYVREYYSPVQHVECYIRESPTDPAEFAERVMDDESEAAAELARFFSSEGPGFVSPAAWFGAYCEFRCSPRDGSVRDDIPVGVIYETASPPPGRSKTVPCVRLRAEDVVLSDGRSAIGTLGVAPSPRRTLWYHATTLGAVERIVRQGVRPDVGSQDLDFGRDRALYLWADARRAVIWAQKRAGGFETAALVLFSLDEDDMRTRYSTLDMRGRASGFDSDPDARRLWEDVVSASRRGMRSACDEVEIAWGPAARVPTVLSDPWRPEPLRPLAMQCALRSHRLEGLLSEAIAGFVLLDA